EFAFDPPIVIERIAAGGEERPAFVELRLRIAEARAGDRRKRRHLVEILDMADAALEPDIPAVKVYGLSAARKSGECHRSEQQSSHRHAMHENPPIANATRRRRARSSPKTRTRNSLISVLRVK